jgi:hypothetical protein
MRVLCALGLVVACSHPAYQLSAREAYEVGEDPTVVVQIRETSSTDAELVIVRPDRSIVKKKLKLDLAERNVRFGSVQVQPGVAVEEPAFNQVGHYKIELRSGGQVLAQQEIDISKDRLTQKLTEDVIAGFAPLVRFTRVRANGPQRWKTYGAVYEHTKRTGVQVQVVIEEPGEYMTDAWKPYEDEGTLAVIEKNNVVVRERTGSATASWVSGDRIVAIRADSMTDVSRGFLSFFLVKFPSSLKH